MRVGFRSGRQEVPRLNFGLHWVRRRQRSLTRGVLGLFCAAWLQAAVVPCVMAHAGEDAPRAVGTDQHQHLPDAHVGHHGQGATPLVHDGAAAQHPCLYCPPGESGPDACDGQGGCAYPHGPQVDARGAASVIFTALPVAFVMPASGAFVMADRTNAWIPDDIPRVRLSVSYCRFIE